MTKIQDIHTDQVPFVAGYFYHVFNRGNNEDNLFFNKDNYAYFLRKYDQYLSDYLETYAFCLIPNHFHLLVKVKSNELAKESFNKSSKNLYNIKLSNTDTNKQIIQQFSNFFNCYTKSINKQQNRNGSLFQKPFKRKIILNEQYLLQIIFYIHLNPVYHQVTNNFATYRWSSYWRILHKKVTKLKKKAVLELFQGQKNFIKYHREELQLHKEVKKYLME